MKTRIRWLLPILAVLIMAGLAYAAGPKLTWDANEDAEYYIVYRGESPGIYTWESNPINVPVTEMELLPLNLPPGTYYFSVKAFNGCGNSSDYSDEIVYVVPEPDSDGDGLLDKEEALLGTNPYDEDTDHDGLLDIDEVYSSHTDPTKEDSNFDGINDGIQSWTSDFDGDGIRDIVDMDVDGDGDLNDEDQNPFTVPEVDTDKDGLPDALEFALGTNYLNPDTDGDGIKDGEQYYTISLSSDFDGDGILDLADTDDDDDGKTDATEKAGGTNPLFNPLTECYKDFFVLSNYYYGVKLNPVTRIPNLYIINLLDPNDQGRLIQYGQKNDTVTSIKNRGDLNGNGYIDVEVFFSGKPSEVRDTGTGAIIATSNIIVLDYYTDFKLAKISGQDRIITYGYCAATNKAIISILDPTKNETVEKQIEVSVGTPINLSVIPDQNGDGIEDFYVSVTNANGATSFIKYNL